MSESFRSFRHLTAYVEQQYQTFAQLKDAIGQVSGLLDAIPEKERELAALEAKATEWQAKIDTLKEGHALTMEQCRKQRKDMQEVLQKEQQERITAREAYKAEQAQWQLAIGKAREELAELQRTITQRKTEQDTLDAQLASTVKAVLRH